jgi:hypothetical protein
VEFSVSENLYVFNKPNMTQLLNVTYDNKLCPGAVEPIAPWTTEVFQRIFYVHKAKSILQGCVAARERLQPPAVYNELIARRPLYDFHLYVYTVRLDAHHLLRHINNHTLTSFSSFLVHVCVITEDHVVSSPVFADHPVSASGI